jgi:hypothetical protein
MWVIGYAPCINGRDRPGVATGELIDSVERVAS